MEELVQCRCGHGVSNHGASGCDGDRFRPCWCTRTRGDVIEIAIKTARTEYRPVLVPPSA
jgi:hypothetical protein